jgi:uncharacterized YigZ family protein
LFHIIYKYTIKQNQTIEIIINKSKFIGIITNINNKEEAKEKINYYKNLYKDATHYCYGYITNSSQKYDDDGEPSSTAGMPILNSLKSNNLTNILCLVIRYFGGIKLGAGGLIRAYSKAANKTLENNIKPLINGFIITIEFPYENIKQIDYLLKEYEIIKNFNNKITYTFKIKEEDYK